MLLSDFIKDKINSNHIIFEYGYYGIKGVFMKDEELSMEGSKEELLQFVASTGSLPFLYACSGECNDFEVLQGGDKIILRYIDFR